MAELLTIGEVSRRSGVAASALRFYEQRGLITSERDVTRSEDYEAERGDPQVEPLPVAPGRRQTPAS